MTTDKRRVLVVDDDEEMLSVFREVLEDAGYDVATQASAEGALENLEELHPGLVVSDLVLPSGMDGLGLMGELQERSPETSCILMTGHSSVESAVKALKMGAFDYLMKPFDPDELAAAVDRVFAFRELQQENARLRDRIAETDGESRLIVGRSESMRRVMNVVRAVAPMPTSVLIRGESGTGKELIAEEIHNLSPRGKKQMIRVNCAALPENLLEDELFGHEKGAFTGAVSQRVGRFEEADGGTIFLDEIAEMSPLLQAKLLRVLQERTFQRVGSNKTIHVDVRVICATNKDLETEVAEGTFREDLYYRVNVVQIALAPLREREEDIPVLAESLARRMCLRLGIPPRAFTSDALSRLQSMNFPGNVRELQNLLERVLIFSKSQDITAEDIDQARDGLPPIDAGDREAEAPAVEAPISSHTTLEEIEREAIRRTLAATGGNMYRAAKILGISRSTLYSKVKKLGLDRDGKAA